MNATTALLVKLLQQRLIATNTIAKKIRPIYEPIMLPVSIPPPVDNCLTVKTYSSVGTIAINTTKKLPKNFPDTNCHRLSGFVCNISNVPVLNSSEKLRMVIAGMSNNSIHGANSKNLSKVAYPKSRILVSGKTKRNNPFNNKKTTRAI